MNSNSASNETSTVATFPPSPKAQTAKEIIAANVKLLIEQLEAGHSESLTAYLTAMGRSESDQHRLILLGNVLLGFAVLLPANADHRSENAYALLAFVDPAAKLVPCVHPGYSGRRTSQSRGFENAAKA